MRKWHLKYIFIIVVAVLVLGISIWWLKHPLNTYFARTPSSPTIEFASPGMCQNEAIRQLITQVVQLELEGDGIVKATQLGGQSSIPETALIAAGLAPEHIKILKAIADYATKDTGILGQTFQALTDPSLRSKLLFCSTDKNCRYKNSSTGATHTPYPIYYNHGNLQVRQLRDFPYQIADLDQLKTYLSTEESHLQSDPSFWSATSSGYAVVMINFRNLTARYPGNLQKFFQPYDDLLHELVHFADYHLFRRWVLANEALKSQGNPPSKLYQDHTLVVNGITYISWDFFSVFTEIRAWILIASLTLQRMRHAGSSEADIDRFSNLIEQTFVQAYFNNGNVTRAFRKKHGITEGNIFNHANTFRDDMLQTIEQAKKYP